jgi:hypothetical protein
MTDKTNPSQKQLFYNCGVESYLVEPKDKIDYKEAKRNPLEFMRKFREQQVVTHRVKKSDKNG